MDSVIAVIQTQACVPAARTDGGVPCARPPATSTVPSVVPTLETVDSWMVTVATAAQRVSMATCATPHVQD